MHYETDTIAAIATPLGKGGIGILRISGKLVPTIAGKLLKKIPDPRKAEYLPFLSEDGSILERVIALFFPEPYSFTGENILEIHGHGSQIMLDLFLDRVLQVSPDIRLANPGEFSERAFLNGKIDLIQAEAIADIIDATSYQAAISASKSLQGIFSNQINSILKKISNLRVHIESSIDFSDEEINIIPYNKVKDILQNILMEIENTYQSAYCGLLLKEGLKIVIAGKPNAGKSSLFNALIGMERAIISKISGTTRDTLYENIQVYGISCHIIDTAGLKTKTKNEIELIGIKKTNIELNQADHILWVVDSHKKINKNDQKNMLNSIHTICNTTINKQIPITIIRNKADLSLEKIGVSKINEYTCITLSALLNNGIDLLRSHLHDSIKLQIKKHSSQNFGENQGYFTARKRHLHALKKSSQFILSARNQLNCFNNNTNTTINECFAEDLKHAQAELNKIVGKFTPDDLLKKIFSTFCIGK